MHPFRHIPIRVAATSVGIAALTVVAGGTASFAGAAAPAKSAQAEYEAAVKTLGTKGVHFSSSAAEEGATVVVVGDTGKTSGREALVVKSGGVTEKMTAMVVGSTSYVTGNAAALQHVLGFTSAQATKYAGAWLSFPTSTSGLNSLVSGLLNSQVASEIQMGAPFTYGPTKTLDGVSALAIKGVVKSGSSTVPVVLYVPATGTPLPIQEVTNPAGSTKVVHGTVAFSNWGETTNPQKPTHTVSLLKLLPTSSSSSTSTTKG